jgi:hypothetical protein
MSNVERLSVEQDVVRLLLNKYQRHRGDTLNSRMGSPIPSFSLRFIEIAYDLQRRYPPKSLLRLKGSLG